VTTRAGMTFAVTTMAESAESSTTDLLILAADPGGCDPPRPV
jgi:hypothetical protein